VGDCSAGFVLVALALWVLHAQRALLRKDQSALMMSMARGRRRAAAVMIALGAAAIVAGLVLAANG
jgi:hypothetical protein